MSQKLKAMGKIYIGVDSKACGGCRRCQLACSLFHYGECNLELASVHVTKDSFAGEYNVEACHQCKEPECLSTCPVEAINIDEKTGTVVIDEKKCIGCRACQQECSYHMIGFIPEKNVCFKCDLCGGDPQCVGQCPFGAVNLVKN